MRKHEDKRRNPILAVMVSATLATGTFGIASATWAQQQGEPQAGSTASSDAARELREAQQQVKEAGEQVAEARAESREAVREGREAGQAAQQAAREETSESSESSTRTASAGGGSAQANSMGGADAPDAVWLFVPVAVSTRTEQQANDCWVRLYSGQNFEGRYITITGPTEIASLRSPYGTGLNNWESAVVGRNATVMTYDGQNFADRDATLRGGQRYADLGDSKLGLFEDIESIRVRCGSSGGSTR